MSPTSILAFSAIYSYYHFDILHMRNGCKRINKNKNENLLLSYRHRELDYFVVFVVVVVVVVIVFAVVGIIFVATDVKVTFWIQLVLLICIQYYICYVTSQLQTNVNVLFFLQQPANIK